MPLAGFLQENATSQLDSSKQVTFEEFEEDPFHSGARLGPASIPLLYSIAQLAEGRSKIQTDTITASQIDDPIRLIWLQSTQEYFVKPSTQIASLTGTIKHAHLLRSVKGIWTSIRLADALGSGEFDSFVVPQGHLLDLKNLGMYKAKLILSEGVMKHARGYVYQLNRYKMLLENPDAVYYEGDGRKRWGDVTLGKAVTVRRLTLEILPRDLTKSNRAQLQALTPVPQIVSVDVPILAEADVRRTYAVKIQAKRRALDDDHSDLCTPEEVWMQPPSKTNGGVSWPERCANWCPVRDLCVEYSHDNGEEHYLDKVQLNPPEES